jgi:glycerophosphoryl diester phosphodiesterase
VRSRHRRPGLSHPFEQASWRARLGLLIATVVGLLLVVPPFIATMDELVAGSATPTTPGLSYVDFQLTGDQIGPALAQWAPLRDAARAAVALDIAFALLYGIGLCLLAGLIADWVAHAPRPVPLAASIFSVSSWLFLAGGAADVLENLLLLFAVLDVDSPGADVAWAGSAAKAAGSVKWWTLGMGVRVVVVAVVATIAAALVAWYRTTKPTRGAPWAPWGFINWAHQGGLDERPGNTLVAFARAAAIAASPATATGLEFDVRMSADHTLMVRHDDELPDGAGSVSLLAASVLADVDLGPSWCANHKVTPVAGEPCPCCGADPHAAVGVPTCAQVLSQFPGFPRTIEIKNSKGAPEALAAIIKGLSKEERERIVVTSIRPFRLLRFRRADSTTATAGSTVGVVWFKVRSVLRVPHMSSHHAALQIPHRLFGRDMVSRRLIADAHRAGLVVHVWTVNDEADMRDLIDRGADGIFTDRPTLLAEVLRDSSAS